MRSFVGTLVVRKGYSWVFFRAPLFFLDSSYTQPFRTMDNVLFNDDSTEMKDKNHPTMSEAQARRAYEQLQPEV